jgi:hypothetical protein
MTYLRCPHESKETKHAFVACLHAAVGDQDEERGVHAVPALAVRVPVRHLLVHLRPARIRPLHRGNEFTHNTKLETFFVFVFELVFDGYLETTAPLLPFNVSIWRRVRFRCPAQLGARAFRCSVVTPPTQDSTRTARAGRSNATRSPLLPTGPHPVRAG